MPKSLADAKTKFTILTAAPADPSKPTVAELKAGINAEGYVMYPDINVVEEMANLMTAQRNYEANVTTVDAVKGMFIKALDIGR